MIVNLTQHRASDEQISAGVVDMPECKLVSELLTFNELPTIAEMQARAETLASLIHAPAGTRVMIGGAPWFMRALESALHKRGYVPVYAFSVRESIDVPQADGSTIKTSVFKHLGFVVTAAEAALKEL